MSAVPPRARDRAPPRSPGPPAWRVPLLAGTAAMVVALPPLGWWPLVVLGPVAWTAVARAAPSGRAAAARLWLAGLLYFGIVNHWLAETHWVNYVLVGLASSAYIAGYGWLAHRVLSRGVTPLALPVLWTAHEMVRLNWPLNGYPWQFVGHAVAASPVLVQAADLGGVLLLSFLVTTVSGGLLAHLDGRRGAGVALVALAALFGYGLWRPTSLQPPRPGPVLAAIQPGFTQVLKDDPLRASERLETCLSLSREALAAAPSPRLLVWPETMWPYLVGEGPGSERAAELMASLLARLLGGGDGAWALLGATVQDLPGRTLANSALLFDAEGRRVARYDKHELVPGGETLPWIGAMPAALADGLRAVVSEMAGYVPDLRPGPGPALMDLDRYRFGVTICYENAYGDYCRRFVQQGADFLVNVSNEGWFGRSTEFDHMELQSVLRAVETRRALFRATNTGISCLVRPDGRRPEGPDRLVVDGRDRDVRGVFAAGVPLHDDATLYVEWGDWPGWTALAGAALLLLRGLRRVP